MTRKLTEIKYTSLLGHKISEGDYEKALIVLRESLQLVEKQLEIRMFGVVLTSCGGCFKINLDKETV